MWLDTSSHSGNESVFYTKSKVIGIHVRKRRVRTWRIKGKSPYQVERIITRPNMPQWFYGMLFDLQLPKQSEVSKCKENEWLKDLIKQSLTTYCKPTFLIRSYLHLFSWHSAAKSWSVACLRMEKFGFRSMAELNMIARLKAAETCPIVSLQRRGRLARYRLIPHLSLTATIFHEYVPRLTEKHSHSWWAETHIRRRQPLPELEPASCSVMKQGWHAKHLWMVAIRYR